MAESTSVWTSLAKVYDPIRCGNIDGIEKDVHDKGIWRAVSATYRPNKGVTGNKDCTLFVGKLNLKTEETTLRKFFEKFGDIKKLRIVRDLVTGYSKGYAFIEYRDISSVKLAHSHANGIFVDGFRILVDFELERSMPGWIPRRLGGGFGGRKESGQLRFGCRDRPFLRPFNAPKDQNIHADRYKDRPSYEKRRSSEKPYSREYRTGNRPSREISRSHDRRSRRDGRR